MTEKDKELHDIFSASDITANDEEIEQDSNVSASQNENGENNAENNGENDIKRQNKRSARSSKRLFRYPQRTTGGVLPLIPMRGMVIYPGVLLSFDVGREQSVEALRYAMDGRHEIILASQMTLDAFWPDPDQIYRIGTRVFIRQVLELPDDTLKVLAYGLERVAIEAFVTEDAHYMVRFTSLTSTAPDKTPILDASMRMMGDLFQRYSAISDRVTPEAVMLVRNETDPGHAADVIAGQLPIRFDEQQQILETISVVDRVQMILKILHREIQLAELEQKIATQVQTQLEKNQKDYYLREQIRVIQEELGEQGDADDDIALLREQLKASLIPDEHKPKIEKEIDRLERLPSHFPEYATQRTWVETLLELPFGRTTPEQHDLTRAREFSNATISVW